MFWKSLFSAKIILMGFALFLFSSVHVFGQVSGSVTSETGEFLPSVSVLIKGSSIGVSTTIDGKYSIDANQGDVLVFSFIGKESKEITVTGSILDVILQSDATVLSGVAVVGSRFAGRSVMSTTSAIDIISAKELVENSVQPDITDLLTSLVPSFQSNKQTIADVSDYSDPATLRGLGQDHTLVLLNGKRYHPNALISILGGNPGQVATDLNSLPSAAISQVEVLRDGASAQYGSDAIAGVMNLKLNESTDKLSVNLFMGSYPEGKSNRKQLEYHPGATIETDGSVTGSTYERVLDYGNPIANVGDGQTLKFDANYGIAIKNEKNEKTGFLNFTVSYAHRGRTNRTENYTGRVLFEGKNDQAKDDLFIAANGGRERFNIVMGNSKLQNAGIFFNMKNKLSGYENTEVYAFGGLNFRKGQSNGFYRFPEQSDRVNRKLYPLGFLPGVHADIIDQTITTGLKSKMGDWDIDISYTYGGSAYDLTVRNSLNRSMGDQTKFQFDVGGYEFTQHVSGIYLSRSYDFLENFNIALGAEYRIDRYALRHGEEASYKDYTLLDTTNSVTGVVDGQKKVKTWAGASQVYPGHRPESAIDENRSNVSFFIDSELDVTEKWLVSAAVRYENYTDFGNVLTGKIATVYRIFDGLSIRSSLSSGFRAPSLQQVHHSTVTNNFDPQGVAHREGTFSNTSPVARLIGIDKLKEETSVSYGVGVMYRLGAFSLTADGYLVNLSDRIINTGRFQKIKNPDTQEKKQLNDILDQYGSESANFFANAIDMKSSGVEIVASYKWPIAPTSALNMNLAYSYIVNEVTGVKYPSLIANDAKGKETFYTKRAKTTAENVIPNHKVLLNLRYSIGDFAVLLRNQYYGSMLVNQDNSGYGANDDPLKVGAQMVHDLLLSYTLFKGTTLSLGVNNLFSAKPDKTPSDRTLSGRFPYFPIQQGFMGRFVFLKLNMSLGV